jgi:hypothetical protein
VTVRRLALLALPLASACVCVDLPNAQFACDDGGCDGGKLPDAGGGGDGGCLSSGLPDLPDDCFTDDDHDGIDGQADASVFVDPMDGDDSQAGTMAAPVRTLSTALLRAVDGGLATVLVAQGEIDESFSWTSPVSIYGGYIADAGWHRTWSPALLKGGPVAIHGSWAGSAVLDSVNVVAGDAPVGGSSFAMIIKGGSVVLRNLELRAGNGGDGASGLSWTTAAPDGTHGLDGLPGETTLDGGSPSTGVPGAGGVSTAAMCSNPSDTAGAGAGQDDLMGGNAVHDITCSANGGLSSNQSPGSACNSTLVGGGNGDNGGDATEGPPGDDGDGGAAVGTLAGPVYVAADGTEGHAGGSGKPGCGGGGGGSSKRSNGNGGGGAGASGGTGGCGGAGGRPGAGGGASVGLLVLNGSAVLVDAGVFAGNGGNGGRGTSGQVGGSGADGGQGGLGGNVCGSIAGSAGKGGNGGKGGKGGQGGSGGGGGGGPSIGIWCVSSTLVGDLSRAFAPPDGGAGGSGDPPGVAGATGLATPVLGKDCH